MQKTITIIFLIAILCLAACQKNDDNDAAKDDDVADDDATQDDDTSDDDAVDDDAADDDTSPTGDKYQMDLKFEFRDSASLTYMRQDDAIYNAAFEAKTGNDLVPGGKSLIGSGKAIRLPETGMEILAIRFTAPPQYSGRCANQSVSLVTSLSATSPDHEYIGGMSARCGAENWNTRPVQVIRLQGKAVKVK